MNWINNDTLALLFLGLITLAGVFMGMEQIVIGGLGAISGYIGSKGVHIINSNTDKQDSDKKI